MLSIRCFIWPLATRPAPWARLGVVMWWSVVAFASRSDVRIGWGISMRSSTNATSSSDMIESLASPVAAFSLATRLETHLGRLNRGGQLTACRRLGAVRLCRLGSLAFGSRSSLLGRRAWFRELGSDTVHARGAPGEKDDERSGKDSRLVRHRSGLRPPQERTPRAKSTRVCTSECRRTRWPQRAAVRITPRWIGKNPTAHP